MGTWGPGLYANDLARDLKSTIGAVLRLPFEAPRLVELISDAFPHAARDEQDEDYTIFWLVLADQLHKRGVTAQDTFDRAIEIVDSGADLQLAQHQEMSESSLRKRKKTLDSLRAQLAEPAVEKPRKTLKKPQPLVMETGDVMVFPVTETGSCFNPYASHADWQQGDWGAFVIIVAGHAFEYLAHYCPIVLNRRLNTRDKPDLNRLTECGWRLERPGTCSRPHFKRMRLERADRIEIDPRKLRKAFPKIRDGNYAAIHDVSIANMIHIRDGPSEDEPRIDKLSEITTS